MISNGTTLHQSSNKVDVSNYSQTTTLTKNHTAKAIKYHNINNVNNSNVKLTVMSIIKKKIPKNKHDRHKPSKTYALQAIKNMSGLNMCVSTSLRTSVYQHKNINTCVYLSPQV